jgi:hypothetical protein
MLFYPAALPLGRAILRLVHVTDLLARGSARPLLRSAPSSAGVSPGRDGCGRRHVADLGRLGRTASSLAG